jgi:hypothetical protein
MYKKAQTSEADSFKNMRVITSYTPEDGHIGQNMKCETVTTYLYNKAACRWQHNLQNPLLRLLERRLTKVTSLGVRQLLET